jgi:hypothetical protein
MSNDHIKSEISAYLAGGLTEARMREIDTHIVSCDKCRNALGKARAKQAHVRREALKKASADPLPNLFLARQGKNAGVDAPPSKGPWVVLTGLVLVGAGYGLYRHFSSGFHSASAPTTSSDPTLDVASSSPAVSSAAVAAAIPAATEAPSPPVPSPIALDVKQQWSGVDSGIKTGKVVVIRNKDAWEELWSDMEEDDPLPPINFNHNIVVCIFAGGHSINSAVALGKIHEEDTTVVVPYSVSGSEVNDASSSVGASSSSATPASNVAAAPSHPFLLSMIPRIDKKIRVTQREVP